MFVRSVRGKLRAPRILSMMFVNRASKWMAYATLVMGLAAIATVFAEHSDGTNHDCPTGMVCLDGTIVPDIGPLPIFSPIAGWNLNFGGSPTTFSPDILIGEIVSVYTESDPIRPDTALMVYEIEDAYGAHHIRRTFQEQEIRIGARVVATNEAVSVEYDPFDLKIATVKPLPPGEKEELGRIMFCDNRLSKDHLYGCATCHLPHHGFADSNPTSLGVDGQLGSRNTPSLYNMAFVTPYFWDGRAVTLEEQALHPLRHPREMDMTARELIERLGNIREIDLVNIAIDRRPGTSADVFTIGVEPACPSAEHLSTMPSGASRPAVIVLGKDLDAQDWLEWKLPPKTRGALICHVEVGSRALAAGLRPGNVIQTINGNVVQNADDLQRIAGSMFDTMDPDEPVQLHVYRQGRPYKDHFRDVFGADINVQAVAEALSSFERTILSANSPFDRYITGLPAPEFGEKEREGLRLFKKKARCILCHNGPNFTDNKFHNVGYPVDAQGVYQLTDLGRYNVTRNPRDKGAFRTPSLRGVSETWPYMHDGNMPSDWKYLALSKDKLDKGLEDVVAFFNRGGATGNNNLDPLMKPLGLSKLEQEALIAFLKSLASKPITIDNCPFNVVMSH